MTKNEPVDIGSLRWRVSLASLNNTAEGTYNVEESYTRLAEVYAEIKPVSLQTFLGGEQLDFAVTHRITFRWQPFFDLGIFNFILRDIVLPDRSNRFEIYKIRRAEEYQGLHWFIIADCEMQKVTS